MQASTREEVIETLRQDIYTKSGVWDVENVSLLLPSFLPPDGHPAAPIVSGVNRMV
jgi:hypothetical protein